MNDSENFNKANVRNLLKKKDRQDDHNLYEDSSLLLEKKTFMTQNYSKVSESGGKFDSLARNYSKLIEELNNNSFLNNSTETDYSLRKIKQQVENYKH